MAVHTVTQNVWTNFLMPQKTEIETGRIKETEEDRRDIINKVNIDPELNASGMEEHYWGNSQP